MFYYDLPGYKLRIYPQPDGRWALSVNGVTYGSYSHAWQAADDAFTQSTGDGDYDLSDESTPQDLGEWEKE